MFLTFHLSIFFVVDVDADLRSNVYGTLPWIRFAWYGARFPRMFWKIAIWMQSATDDPGFVPLLPWDIRFSTNKGVKSACQSVYSEYVEGSQRSRILMCVYLGKCLLTLCERVIQKKTINPFNVNTIRLDALLQHK